MNGNMALKKGNMALMKGNMALTKGNMLERARWNTAHFDGPAIIMIII